MCDAKQAKQQDTDYPMAATNKQELVRNGHDIGWAVKQIRNGSLVRRRGWNGRGMHLALQRPDTNSKMTLPYVFMKTVDGDLVPWLCSQTDLLSADWEFAEI